MSEHGEAIRNLEERYWKMRDTQLDAANQFRTELHALSDLVARNHSLLDSIVTDAVLLDCEMSQTLRHLRLETANRGWSAFQPKGG